MSAPGSSSAPPMSASASQGGEVSCFDIDRLLVEAQLAAIPDNMPKFPWETGSFKAIFGEGMAGVLSPPVLRQPSLVPIPGVASPPPEPAPVQSASGKRKHAHLFHECSAKASRDENADSDEHLWNIALSKWVTVFILCEHQGSTGAMLQDSFWSEDGTAREDIIRDVLGLKAPRTASKRANDLLRCFRWHVEQGKSPWPWSIKSLSCYIESLKGTKGYASATATLFQAINFAHHVVDIPFSAEILSDRRLQGRAKRLIADSGPLKQATALRVEQVIQLEIRTTSSETCVQDKFLLGGMLFTLYSRSRWSDHRLLDFILFDECGAPTEGFIEAQTSHHKTRNCKKAAKRAMPLVAPMFSWSGHDWASAWYQAGVELGFPWDASPLGPLVRVPGFSGVSKRKCSSAEASAILRSALEVDASSGVSSHSLKVTTLNWCGKRGLPEFDCLMLGHHVTGSKSRAVYSRELLSAPLRSYVAMLKEIKAGVFKPDASRSGWLSDCAAFAPSHADFRFDNPKRRGILASEPAVSPCDMLGPDAGACAPRSPQEFPESPLLAQDAPGEFMEGGVRDHADDDVDETSPPSWGGALPDNTALPGVESERDAGDASSDESDSSSSSDSNASSGQSIAEEGILRNAGAAQSFDVPGPLWQHRGSKMLHKAVQGSEMTKCSRRTGGNAYLYLPEGSVSKWTRCSTCFRGELITSKGGMVAALDALSAPRAST